MENIRFRNGDALEKPNPVNEGGTCLGTVMRPFVGGAVEASQKARRQGFAWLRLRSAAKEQAGTDSLPFSSISGSRWVPLAKIHRSFSPHPFSPPPYTDKKQGGGEHGAIRKNTPGKTTTSGREAWEVSISVGTWVMSVLITAMLGASFGYLLASCVDFDE